MTITSQTLYDVIDGTWPAATYNRVGPWTIREGKSGGNRVSAATADGAFSGGEIPDAEKAMAGLGQNPQFMIREGEQVLDSLLAARGYRIADAVNLYAAPIETIATEKPPRVSCWSVWEPLAIQIDIWAHGGIGAGRLAVMDRAKGPKTSLLGRLNDSPAGTAFWAMHGGIAMGHAIEVLPHQRRQNMGKYFMRQAAYWAADQGASHVSVVCTQENAAANALYSSLGMSLVGQYHYRRKS